MPLPQSLTKFTTTSPLLTSYDWVDVATGVGFQTFYLCVDEIFPAVKSYFLTENIMRSRLIEHTSADFASTPYYAVDSVDYDLSAFNTARTIKGTGHAVIGAQMEALDINSYIKVIIRKWDGATETDIVSVSGSSIPASGNAIVLNMPLVIPETRFKIGEILRCTIETWGQKNAGDLGATTYGTDPQDRDGTLLTPTTEDTITKSHIIIPYKLQ